MNNLLAVGVIALGLMGCAVSAADAAGEGAAEPPAAPPAPEKLAGVKVLTDGYVDTSSRESIVAGVTKGAESDEQKVLALYHWYRRVIFHHRFMGGDRRDVLKEINSYGCNLCGSQSAVFVILLQQAGFKTRVVAGKASGDFGTHTFVEVFYDGKWHCLDTMTSFAVYTRDEPPHVASLEEMKADPTLVAKAVEEKRGLPGFLYCMDHQEHAGADKAELAKTMGKADLTWSTLLFTAGSLLDFWEQAPAKSRVLDAGGTYGGRYTPGVTDFTLKANEELVRLWDNQGKWVKAASHPDFGPHHTCGYADEHDPVNFKYYEPYLKENFGHTKKCYRYFGNGWLEWKPRAAAELLAAGRAEGLTADAAGRLAAAPGAAGSLTVPVKSPYAGVEIELDLDLDQQGEASQTRVLLAEAGKPREVWKKSGEARGIEKIVIPHDRAGLFEYELRIEARSAEGGAAAFRPVRLRTVFQENIYALPGLLPGKNTVTVSAAEPAKLAACRLVVQYDWEEGEGWKTPKSVSKELAELPASFEVEAAGPKLPRMKRLVLRLAPAAGAGAP